MENGLWMKKNNHKIKKKLEHPGEMETYKTLEYWKLTPANK